MIKYSGNYSDKSGSLWQFKRADVSADNADSRIDNSESFKYKAAFSGIIANHIMEKAL